MKMTGSLPRNINEMEPYDYTTLTLSRMVREDRVSLHVLQKYSITRAKGEFVTGSDKRFLHSAEKLAKLVRFSN